MQAKWDWIGRAAGFDFTFMDMVQLVETLRPAFVAPCRILVDLEDQRFFNVDAVVPLIALSRDLSDRGWTVNFALPDDDFAYSYWEKAGWISAISSEDEEDTSHRDTFTRLFSYEDHTRLNVVINEILDVLTREVEFGAGANRALEWTINELADNVLVHAGGVTGFVEAASRRKLGFVTVVVVDTGMGIRQTLEKSYPNIKSDEDAIELAIQQGVTRDKAIGQGNGLAGSMRIAEAAGGYANVWSGQGLLQQRGDGSRAMRHTVVPFGGTVVTVSLPTSAPVDVATALWGHEPSSSFEFTHVNDSGILFQLQEESSGYGNRGSGAALATRLRNIMNEVEDEGVIIDFSGIESPSASFLDEFLAKLIKEIGPATFFSRCQFRDMNDFTRRTVDAVISQRMSVTE